MSCRQKSCVEILDRNTEFLGSITVENCKKIRTEFLYSSSHTVNTIVVRGNYKRGQFAVGHVSFLRPGSNSQIFSAIFEIARRCPASRFRIQPLVHSRI